jgi:hypothetical protein
MGNIGPSIEYAIFDRHATLYKKLNFHFHTRHRTGDARIPSARQNDKL